MQFFLAKRKKLVYVARVSAGLGNPTDSAKMRSTASVLVAARPIPASLSRGFPNQTGAVSFFSCRHTCPARPVLWHSGKPAHTTVRDNRLHQKRTYERLTSGVILGKRRPRVCWDVPETKNSAIPASYIAKDLHRSPPEADIAALKAGLHGLTKAGEAMQVNVEGAGLKTANY